MLQFNGPQTPATGAVGMYLWKQFMKSQGWTVPFSSDGTTYSATGDILTSGASGAGGLGNANAFFGLVDPAGIFAYCAQRGSSNTQWYLKFAPSGGFAGGSPSATQTPTGVSQLLLAGCTGTDAAPGFSGSLIQGADGTYRIVMAADPVAPYSFYLVGYKIGGDYGFNACPLGFFQSRVPAAQVPQAGAPSPLTVIWANGALQGGNSLGAQLQADGSGWLNTANFMNAYGMMLDITDSNFAGGTVFLVPLIWATYSHAMNGADEMVACSTGSNPKSPRMLSLLSPADHFEIGEGFVFPWNGTVLTDSQGTLPATYYLTVKPPASLAAPDLDIANFLAAQGLGLTLQNNLFVGPVRPVVSAANIPPAAVFVLSTPGAEPLKYFGPSSAGSVNMGMIQIRVRGAPGVFDVAQNLTRSIRDALHRNVISGYFYCAARQSQPEYLGQDAQGNEEFSINFDLWSVTTP